jgi:hypothetical protein
MRKIIAVLSFLMFNLISFSQDTSIKELHVSGSIGVTNNGISIIPTFSLKQSPFVLMYMMNKEIRSNVVGSVNFDWNVSLLYNFSNKFKSFK